MNILITGSTGMVGSALSSKLKTAGHSITRLVRSNPSGSDIIWDPQNGKLDASRFFGGAL